ncbi:prolyl oligopeptidase family serine peptidase [Verrucomicrobiaceae bacterium 227]
MKCTPWARPTLPRFLALSLVFGILPHAAAEEPKPEKKPATETVDRKARKKGRNKSAPAEAQKQPITPADYGRWERLLGNKLSADGRWLTSEVARVDEERRLDLHNLKSKKTEAAVSYKQGSQAIFSDDSAWLAVAIGKSPAQIKKEQKAGDKAPKSAGKTIKLRQLKNGETTGLENVGDFSFSADSHFAAMEIVPKTPSGAGPGKVLIIRELASGQDTTFGNVVRHAWSDRGALLAMVIDSPSISNALQVFDPSRGTLRTLESNEENYAALVWRDDAMDLAAMREMKHGEKEDVSHVLLAWRNLDKAKPVAFSYEHAEEKTFPKDMYISGGKISWSKDGKSISCDLMEWEDKPKDQNADKMEDAKEAPAEKEKDNKKPKPEPKPKPEASPKKEEPQTPQTKPLRETIEEDSNVEVWHSRDVEIMPLQKKKATQLKNPKRRSVWWLDTGKLVQLGTELTEQVNLLRSGTHAMGVDYTPHERTAMFGPRLFDLYLIDATTGERECIEESLKYQLESSPNGRYLIYLRDGQVWSHDIKTDQKHNLTGELETHFTNQEDDTLAAEKRPYGNATWLKDSSALLLYDRFDIWKISPNGSAAIKLTNGTEDMIRHRLSQASFRKDDEGTIDPKKPLFVALYGELTKKSGYAKLQLDQDAKRAAKLDTLLWEDRAISQLSRAEDANVYTFVKERSDDSPDLFAARGNLRKARQITDTNSFQKDFLWGRSELVDFKNKNGVPLQGSLTYPANYKPGQKYPMIVYIYEDRSQDLHRYSVPTEKHPYNPAVYSAEGYFVFQPDIIYRPQEPGISAVECVVPAVEEVLKTGLIDEDRVGLVGHSWGAYQTAFIVTQTDLFAAGIAGAPLTNMMSMAVSVYWNSGQSNAWIFSQSQGRMDQPFWRNVDNYVRNSPIHGLDDLNTPLLMAFGDKDGAVDWGQGVQMYNAARWAGKDDLVMLVYPGENHSLRKEENMVDYHYRVLEWFGHYLKETEAPKWITEGKSYLDRKEELENKDEAPKPAAEVKTKPKPQTEAPKKAKKEKSAAARKKARQQKRKNKKPTPEAAAN